MRGNLLNRFKYGTMEPRELQSIIKLAKIFNQQLHKWWRMLNFCSFCVYLWPVPDDPSRAYFLLQVPSNPNTAEWSLLNVILPTKDSAGRLIAYWGLSANGMANPKSSIHTYNTTAYCRHCRRKYMKWSLWYHMHWRVEWQTLAHMLFHSNIYWSTVLFQM